MTLALVAVVCATLLVLQREVLKYLREYHGTASRLTKHQAQLEDHADHIHDVQAAMGSLMTALSTLKTFDQRLRDVETTLQAQRIIRK